MDDLYLMTPLEIATGYLFGLDGALPPPTGDVSDPRAVLERVVREALLYPPCGVAFSGGRDSSLVLAVATHVARREGLAEPIPLTRVFPDIPESDEHDWQLRVVRHLGLSDWQRIELHDELDIVGPLATKRLAEHGVVWPPTSVTDIPLVEAVPGGSLLDGEGGDEVLDTAAHRIAPLERVVRSPRPLRRKRIRSALGAVAPRSTREDHARRVMQGIPLSWLRPDVRNHYLDTLARGESEKPLSFAASVRRVPRRRTQVLTRHNRRIFASASGVDVSSPLLHPDFVHALARHGGYLGLGDRTTMLRSLVPDLLPDDVLARTTKSFFTRCYLGDPTREFARQWSGEGLDPDLVDADAVRECWLEERPNAMAAALLQAAWLADHRRTSG